MNPLDAWGGTLSNQNRLRNPVPGDVPAFLHNQPFEWPSEARQHGPSGGYPLWDARGATLAQQAQADDLPLSLFGNDLSGPGFLFDHPGQQIGQPGDRGGLDDLDARQKAKIQEKNRKAQKRFRERQKTKFTGLTSKVEELEARVSLLMQEKSKLEDRTLVLEKVLDLRKAGSDAEASSNASADGAPTLALSPSTSRGAVSREDAFLDDGTGDNNASYVFQDNLTLEVPGEEPRTLTPDAVKKLTSKEVQGIYQSYVLAMKGLLEQCAMNKPSRAGVLLTRLVRELSALLVRVVALNPIVSRQMHQEDNPCTPLSIHENLALSRKIADVLLLSVEQRDNLVSTVTRFREQLEGIVKERQQIFARMHPPSEQGAQLGPSSEPAIDDFLLVTQGTIALKENLRQEHWEVLNLLTRCFQITNVVQTARFMVESHPRWFDYIALASVLASEDGQAQGQGQDRAPEQPSTAGEAAVQPAQRPASNLNLLAAPGGAGPSSRGPGPGRSAAPPAFPQDAGPPPPRYPAADPNLGLASFSQDIRRNPGLSVHDMGRQGAGYRQGGGRGGGPTYYLQDPRALLPMQLPHVPHMAPRGSPQSAHDLSRSGSGYLLGAGRSPSQQGRDLDLNYGLLFDPDTQGSPSRYP